MSKIEPKINDMLLDTFGAKMLKYQVDAVNYDKGHILPPSSMIPVKTKPSVGLRKITLELDFEGDNLHKITENISNLTALLYSGVEIQLPDGYLYGCVYESTSTPEEKAPWILQVKFTLLGYRHLPLETITISCEEQGGISTSVFVNGNYKTPAVVKITATSSLFVFNDVTVTNIAGVIVIDGIKKTVTQDGINKYIDTNLMKFPELQVGNNNIVLKGKGTVEISYYPICV